MQIVIGSAFPTQTTASRVAIISHALPQRQSMNKHKQQLPQNSNSQVEASECLEGTVLLSGQQCDCHAVIIVIRSAALKHTTVTRGATTRSAALLEQSKHKKQTKAAAKYKLTRSSVSMPAGNCTPCRSTIRLAPYAHRHRVSSFLAHNSNARGNHKPCTHFSIK